MTITTTSEARLIPEGRSDTFRDLVAWRLPVVVAVSCAAFGMPLLDLYGRNPTVFVSANLTWSQIVIFGLVVVLGPAAIAIFVEVFIWNVYRPAIGGVHTGLVGLFGTVLALSILRQVAPDIGVLALVIAIAAGVGVAAAERRWTPIRVGLRYAAILPVVVLFMFFFTSPTSRLFDGEARAVDLGAAGGGDGDDPPILFLVLDELPVSSLMGLDGTVREDLFPNFAEVQETSTWYRNVTVNAPGTELSVPSVLSGLEPNLEAVGSSIDWPRNLFTLLGGRYAVQAHEEATHLCPSSICTNQLEEDGSVMSSLEDAAVVFGHLTAPSNWREDLPSIDTAWGGFIAEGEGEGATDEAASLATDTPDETDETDETDEVDGDAAAAAEGDVDQAARDVLVERGKNAWDDKSPSARLQRLQRVTDQVDGDAPPTLYFAHIVFPHWPWETSHSGLRILDPKDVEMGRDEGGPERNRWYDDPNLSRFWLQRHLLQLGAADQALGEVIDRFEAEGIWDDMIVIVTADHGASFTPGEVHRGMDGIDNFDQIYRVPLFIKTPGQTEGEIVDEPAQSIDILPTLVDLLGLDVDWEFDGRSLVSDPPAATRRASHSIGVVELPNEVDTLFDKVAEKEARFSGGTGWLSVIAVGELGKYVGHEVDSVDLERVDGVSFEFDQSRPFKNVDLSGDEPVPVVLSGSVELPDWDGGRELLLTVNGKVAGVAHLENDGPTTYTWAGVIAEELLVEGQNEFDLFVPAPD